MTLENSLTKKQVSAEIAATVSTNLKKELSLARFADLEKLQGHQMLHRETNVEMNAHQVINSNLMYNNGKNISNIITYNVKIFIFILGLQLGIEGRCEPCPRGTFRTQGVQPACQSCPRGRTTLKVGASAVEECSLPVCTPGNN